MSEKTGRVRAWEHYTTHAAEHPPHGDRQGWAIPNQTNQMITLEKLAAELTVENMKLIVAGDGAGEHIGADGNPTGSGSWTITGPGKSLSDLGWW